MAERQKDHYFGRFKIDSVEVQGELTSKGEDSNLYIESATNLKTENYERFVFGTLRGNKKVTLVNCLFPYEFDQFRNQDGNGYFSANVFPHGIVFGDHIDPDQDVIKSLSFKIDDGRQVFPDREVFGSVRNPREKIKGLLEGQFDREIGQIPRYCFLLERLRY